MTEVNGPHRAAVSRGREAAGEPDWEEAFHAFSDADTTGELSPEDLELWASSAYLLGQVQVAIDALTRAHRDQEQRGETARAVRTGFWVAFILMNRGDVAQAGGWLARCHRLVVELPADAAEHGFLLVPDGYRQVALEGDLAQAQRTGQRVVEIGRRNREPDLVAMGLLICGRALIRDRRADEGLDCLDEAMVAVVSGELTATVAGTIYCSLIEACEEISELRRAQEWTGALTRWMERQQGMVTFTGQCLTHRSAILRHRGDWPGAEEEARRACERFLGAADEHATGRALYQLGEVHRLRGESDQADDAYRRASDWGHEPQPGLALLRLAQGRTQPAVSAMERMLKERTTVIERIPLLSAYVDIMLAAGLMEAAGTAAAELEAVAATFGTSALRAEAERARGAVALAEGDTETALSNLRSAYDRWQTLDAPYEAARTRVLIGEACRALGDVDSAGWELEAARTVFIRLGAEFDLARLPAARYDQRGLTTRELEVLRLVATGRTNQAVADELFLAVKTVDRHVANILTKLGVPTRTAATAFAYEHQLLK